MTTATILGLNAGYFLGYTGRLRAYAHHPLRGVIGDRAQEQDGLDRFADLITQHDPDIIGIVETDQGSVRTRTDGQLNAIMHRLGDDGPGYVASSGLKYRDDPITNRIPVLRHMANAAMVRDGTVRTHRLHRGWKRLLLEVRYAGLSVFIAHLPLAPFRRTQQHQLREIAGMMADRDHAVLYGDLNIHDDGRLAVLRERAGATIHCPDPTYPAYDPQRCLDRVITGPGVTLEDEQVLDTVISDHLPVLAEVSW